jgi:L-lactate dehydrogenase complex protein LldG
VVDAFRARLEACAGTLHEAGSLEAARARARELVGGATVARWADAVLDGIAEREAPAAEAEVSLIVADAGVVESGAIAFAHGPGRPRAAGLLPERQIALLRADALVPDMSAALARLLGREGAPPSNVVFAGGPSRTADIEQRAILGVHAPRRVDVILF